MRYLVLVLMFFLSGVASVVFAGEREIQFPVAELGHCGNETACFAYCEEPAHFDACMQFARDAGLVSEDEVRKYEQAKVVVERGGPGGCDSPKSCEAYCSDITHLNECLTVAEREGLMTSEELAEAKKVKAALDAGATLPGGCTNKQSCEVYCENPSHVEECFAFAEAAGFIPAQEREQTKKAIELMKSGATPGGCVSRDACEKYCMEDDHFEECVEFGIKSGLMDEQEVQRMREMGSFGPPEEVSGELPEGPGGCRGEECFQYCMDEANLEECVQFSEKMMGENFGDAGPMMQDTIEQPPVWEQMPYEGDESNRPYEFLELSPQQFDIDAETGGGYYPSMGTEGDDWLEYDPNLEVVPDSIAPSFEDFGIEENQ